MDIFDMYIPLFSSKSKTIIASFNNVELYKYRYQIEREIFDEVIACIKSATKEQRNILKKNKIISFGIKHLDISKLESF